MPWVIPAALIGKGLYDDKRGKDALTADREEHTSGTPVTLENCMPASA